MHAPPSTPSVDTGVVVVGIDGAGLRRQLGPVAWCALEAVVAISDEQNVAAMAVRSLAVELGVSKNTAQRTLAVLRDAGLIEPMATRRDRGRFGGGSYRVTVPASALARTGGRALASAVAETPARSRRPRRSRARRSVVEQLSLLPEV